MVILNLVTIDVHYTQLLTNLNLMAKKRLKYCYIFFTDGSQRGNNSYKLPITLNRNRNMIIFRVNLSLLEYSHRYIPSRYYSYLLFLPLLFLPLLFSFSASIIILSFRFEENCSIDICRIFYTIIPCQV